MVSNERSSPLASLTSFPTDHLIIHGKLRPRFTIRLRSNSAQVTVLAPSG